MQNKYVHAVVVATLLGGFLTISSAALAASDGDAVPRMSEASSSTSKEMNGIEVGTAVGISSSYLYDAPAAEPVEQKARRKSVVETASKILDAISKHPVERAPKLPQWRTEQNKAVEAARAGRYDEALATLARLHADRPLEVGISSDYAAILGWAGRDAEAVAAFKTLPPGDHPNYLVDSIGHAYRNLHQPEEALLVYRDGLKSYPDNHSFLAGEILSLMEGDHLKEAVAYAQKASEKHAMPSEPLVVAIKLTFRANAVALARAGKYKPALAEFAMLHDKYPSDTGISGDYVAVLSWAGRDTEATVHFRSLVADEQPDYVLDAAAHSYRNLRQPQHALDLYQAALAKTPDNVVYAVGVIYSLADLGRGKEALAFAEDQMAKHPEKPEALVKAYIYVERRMAIDLARAGHFDQALAMLRALRAKYPSDTTDQMDYIAVSSWAGHHADAVKEYQKIARQRMPDYVLEAVGGSYRALEESEKALVVYKRGLKQSPANDIFAAGEVRCLDDLERYAEGQAHAETYTARYGDHLDVLLAGGEAANFNEKHVDALNFYQHAAAMAPKNREALRGMIHAEDQMGAAHLALKHADARPDLMNGVEYRAIVGDADQALVRWGPLEPVNEASRFVATDRALASLDAHIGQWKAQNNPDVYPNILRARFDRLIALRDRQRMQDVVTEYNALVHEGVELPVYALIPVGEAYLALRQPEIARDIFKLVLQYDPKVFEARRLLAYAYLESQQYDEAYAAIDELRESEPIWIYLKGEPERQPNPNRATVERDAGALRNYGELLQDADDKLTTLVSAGPFDARNRDAAGNVYMARGWPRKAMSHYQVGLAIQDGHDVANETGIGAANLALQNFEEVEAKAKDLAVRFPENLGVQRLNRNWQVHNMAELDVHAGVFMAPTGKASAGDVSHGQGQSVGAKIYSAPINYNWRVFAGQDYAHESEPNEEGHIDYMRSTAGVEYRKGDVTASIAPTLNKYDRRERIGADGVVKYAFNDIWSASIAAQMFSATTPLRALNAGVTSNQYDASVMWRQSESRELTVRLGLATFSDHNIRTQQEAEYIERLYTTSRFKLDAETNLGLSQNSKDQNRLYYNPARDLSLFAGLRATEALYRRYETLYEHSLLAMPGFFSQKHYGTTPAWLVRYEQRVHYNDTLNAGAGVNYSHQSYNGAAEDALSLTVDVVERF